MKRLLRLYPRSWRTRYGAEMEELVNTTPGGVGTALDLCVGAAVAYRDLIARSRVLSAAGACLHGMCVAVLVQAIGFVTLILVSQRSADPTELTLGPFLFAIVDHAIPFPPGEVRNLAGSLGAVQSSWLPQAALLTALAAALVALLAAPRLVRRLG